VTSIRAEPRVARERSATMGFEDATGVVATVFVRSTTTLVDGR
jgi:hypothetical protein